MRPITRARFNSPSPVRVVGLDAVTAITAGVSHTVARKQDGTVWTWGLNDYGQLGNGTTSNSPVPVRMGNLGNISTLAAGNYHTVVVSRDGTVWASGYNSVGQLGDGTQIHSSSPIMVSGLWPVAY